MATAVTVTYLNVGSKRGINVGLSAAVQTVTRDLVIHVDRDVVYLYDSRGFVPMWHGRFTSVSV